MKWLLWGYGKLKSWYCSKILNVVSVKNFLTVQYLHPVNTFKILLLTYISWLAFFLTNEIKKQILQYYYIIYVLKEYSSTFQPNLNQPHLPFQNVSLPFTEKKRTILITWTSLIKAIVREAIKLLGKAHNLIESFHQKYFGIEF